MRNTQRPQSPVGLLALAHEQTLQTSLDYFAEGVKSRYSNVPASETSGRSQRHVHIVEVMMCCFSFTCKCSRGSCLIHQETPKEPGSLSMPRIMEHIVAHKVRHRRHSICQDLWNAAESQRLPSGLAGCPGRACVRLNWFKLLAVCSLPGAAIISTRRPQARG